MQIRLTVLGPQGGPGADVTVSAPTDTPLAAVLGGLASAAAPGGGAPGSVYCGTRRLDPRRALLGREPLVDGALLAFSRPAEEAGPEAAAGAAAAPARLLVVSGPDAGGVHLLHGGEIRIGRSASADVPLDDPDVSRLHCRITVAEDGSLSLRDAGSTNGTALDGVPVGGDPVPLPPGAELRLGETVLRVSGGGARPAGPAEAVPAAVAAGTERGRLRLAGWGRRRPGPPPPREAADRPAAPPPVPPGESRWPDPATVLLTAVEAGPRLWERDIGHGDGLTVRLGTAQRGGDGAGVPVTVDLAALGSLGLAGPRPRLAGLARSVLAQLAVLHPPGALELVVVAPGRAADWSWLGWLPHTRPTTGQDCHRLLAFDGDQAAARLRELLARTARPGPDGAAAGGNGRRTVVLVDGPPADSALTPALLRLAQDGPEHGTHLLMLAESPAASPLSPLGATLARARGRAPAVDHCGMVAVLSGDVATAVRLVLPGGTGQERAARPGPGSAAPGDPAVTHALGHVAAGQALGPSATVDAVSPAWAERVARALAPLAQEPDGPARPGPSGPEDAGAALPESSRLLDLLALPRVTPGALRARWAASAGLPLPLGAGAGGGAVTIDLAALPGPLAVDGPPGSGRTELLCSLAAGLAAARSPRELSLLLVDGADEGLRRCAELPHVADRLRTTDPARMRAVAQALREELKRRASLLAGRTFPEWEAAGRPGSPRVVSPREPADDAGDDAVPPPALRAPGSGPLPRLVVLVDDMAALRSPELGAPGRPAAGSVVRALDTVARDGARLGVLLITTAEPALVPDAPRVTLTGAPAGRGLLRGPGGGAQPLQAGRVTGRIPRTATLRPTVTALDWRRAGDPPARRPVRELGNGPTDVALLASAAARAAAEDSAASLV